MQRQYNFSRKKWKTKMLKMLKNQKTKFLKKRTKDSLLYENIFKKEEEELKNGF